MKSIFLASIFYLFFLPKSFGQGENFDNSSNPLYLFNGKVYNGNLTDLKSEVIYVIFTEPNKNILFDPYFPNAAGIVFVYSQNKNISIVSAESFKKIIKDEREQAFLYKIDTKPITDKRDSLDDLSINQAKSIIMIKNFSMKNIATCKDDYYTLFLINMGYFYQKGVSDWFLKINK